MYKRQDMSAAHAEGDGAGFMDANYRYRDAWTALVPNRRLVRAIELYADHVRYLRVFTLDDAQVRAVVLRGLRRLAVCLLYTSPSPRDRTRPRMPSSA